MIDNYEDFFNVIWDEVSQDIVTDYLWEKFTDEFLELTFNLYSIYKNNIIRFPDSTVIPATGIKVYARIIENFSFCFKKVIK